MSTFEENSFTTNITQYLNQQSQSTSSAISLLIILHLKKLNNFVDATPYVGRSTANTIKTLITTELQTDLQKESQLISALSLDNLSPWLEQIDRKTSINNAQATVSMKDLIVSILFAASLSLTLQMLLRPMVKPPLVKAILPYVVALFSTYTAIEVQAIRTKFTQKEVKKSLLEVNSLFSHNSDTDNNDTSQESSQRLLQLNNF